MNILAEVKKTLDDAIDGQIHVLDPQQDQTHLEAIVISDEFEGLSLVKRHKRVMQPLTEHFATRLHALALKTYTPKEYKAMTQTSSIQDEIKQEIDNNRIILFMKGNRAMPMCGFSARVVEILNSYEIDFETRNVLDSDELRQGIKDFSDWPTLPQLYIDQEFIGGCDIVMQLHETGELAKIIAQ